MSRYPFLFLLALCLSACTHLPEGASPEPLVKRSDLRHFAVDARFALKMQSTTGEGSTSGGRLQWTHREDADRILLSNPLGIGLAEIERRADQAELRTADGRIYRASAMAPLISELTGQHWPIDLVPNWLLGRPGPEGKLSYDTQARPHTLEEQTWRIEYFYDNDAPDALPVRLNAYGENAELRLRIESWNNTP